MEHDDDGESSDDEAIIEEDDDGRSAYPFDGREPHITMSMEVNDMAANSRSDTNQEYVAHHTLANPLDRPLRKVLFTPKRVHP